MEASMVTMPHPGDQRAGAVVVEEAEALLGSVMALGTDQAVSSSSISYSRPWRASSRISPTAVLPSSRGAKPEAPESALGHGSPA